MLIPLGFAGGLHDRDIGWVRFGWRDYDPLTARFTAKDPIGYAGGDNDLYGYCLDDPVNGIDPLGLEADCLSLDVNAAGFGGRVEAGGGICWDDEGDLRGMGHADIGASTGWGVGGSGTWQTTDAESVDDLSGPSMVTGASQSVVPGPWNSRVTVGVDRVHADKYNGEAYSVGLGWGKPSNADIHTQVQNTRIWGGNKK